jgi:hypothetical protein
MFQNAIPKSGPPIGLLNDRNADIIIETVIGSIAHRKLVAGPRETGKSM